MMSNTEINMPVAKAASAITAAVTATSDVPHQVVQAATATWSYNAWLAVNSIPWGTLASIAATIYTLILIGEWFWKKLWRPFFERTGWIKKRRHRVLTLSEFQALQETDNAPL